MKRNFICVLAVAGILLALVSSAFGLSDKEYKQMMKNSSFAQADKALNQAYKNAQKSLPKVLFEDLKKEQMSWIEINCEKCGEFSSEFNFNETGRYAISKSGKIYGHDGEKYISLK